MTLKLDTEEQFEAWMMDHAKPFNWDIRPDGPVFMPEDVRALYEALRPRWISCKERMPEIKRGMNYSKLVQFVAYDQRCFGYLYSEDGKRLYWIDCEDEYYGPPKEYALDEVTAWMEIDLPPLPEES